MAELESCFQHQVGILEFEVDCLNDLRWCNFELSSMDWSIQATCKWNFNGFSKWMWWSSFDRFRYTITPFSELFSVYCNLALKQSGRDCNPVVIRKAIENSSLMPKDKLSSDALQLTYGCGLLQVIL